MVDKSPDKNKNSITQILDDYDIYIYIYIYWYLDDYDIDGKSLHYYVKDGSEMNLILRVCSRIVYKSVIKSTYTWLEIVLNNEP